MGIVMETHGNHFAVYVPYTCWKLQDRGRAHNFEAVEIHLRVIAHSDPMACVRRVHMSIALRFRQQVRARPRGATGEGNRER